MTWQQRHDGLVAAARRLVDGGIIAASRVTINVDAGTVRDRGTDQLLHYESGVLATALHIRPQAWGEA